jgi:hypothetical protein
MSSNTHQAIVHASRLTAHMGSGEAATYAVSCKFPQVKSRCNTSPRCGGSRGKTRHGAKRLGVTNEFPRVFLGTSGARSPGVQHKVSGPGVGSKTPLTAETGAEKRFTRRVNGDSGWSVVPVGGIHVHAQACSSWTAASVRVCFGSPLRPRRGMHPRAEESGVPETEKR